MDFVSNSKPDWKKAKVEFAAYQDLHVATCIWTEAADQVPTKSAPFPYIPSRCLTFNRASAFCLRLSISSPGKFHGQSQFERRMGNNLDKGFLPEAREDRSHSHHARHVKPPSLWAKIQKPKWFRKTTPSRISHRLALPKYAFKIIYTRIIHKEFLGWVPSFFLR